MPNYQLTLIRQYCDTAGTRLSSHEKDLLCKILEDPERYNGFTSKLYTETDSGRDYRDTWTSVTNWQYRILIDPSLRIAHRYRHCCDGYNQEKYWAWKDAWIITDARKIVNILKEIESEL